MSYLPPPPPGAGAGGWNPVGPYATSSMPMPAMRPLKGLATALLVLLILSALAQAAGAVARSNRADLIDEIVATPFAVGEQEGIDADNAVAAASIAHWLLLIAIAVVFMNWQFRHAKNAEVLGARGGLGPGWAIGGWFIPLANFVLPALQISQSSKASDLTARQQRTKPKGGALVVLWAIVFGLGIIVLLGSGGLLPSDEEGNIVVDSISDLEEVADSDRSASSGHVILVPAALLGIAMVRSLTKKQTTAYAAVAGSTGPPPAVPGWGNLPPPPPPAAPPTPSWPQVPPPPGAPPPPPPPPT